MAIADGDKHDDYMKFAFQLVLQHKNISFVDECWPSVTSFCQIATATETHKAKNDHFAFFCESFLSVQGRCSRALEGGAFCRDVVNLNFPKSRFRCTWAGCTNYQITQIPRHPSSIYQTRVFPVGIHPWRFSSMQRSHSDQIIVVSRNQNQKLPPVLVRLGKYLQVTRFIQYLSDLTNIYHMSSYSL